MLSKSKVAIFGGAFDPVSNAHLMIIDAILKSSLVESVLIVPSGARSDKEYFASVSDRLEMLKLAIKGRFNSGQVEISQLQIDGTLPAGSYTYDLINYLQTQNSEVEYYWVIGTDLLSQIPNWKNAEWLLKNLRFLILERSQYKIGLPSNLFSYQLIDNLTPSNISSSLIRSKIKNNLEVSGLLPDQVDQYIKLRKLYS